MCPGSQSLRLVLHHTAKANHLHPGRPGLSWPQPAGRHGCSPVWPEAAWQRGSASRRGTSPGQCSSCHDQINSQNVEAGSLLCGGISLDLCAQGPGTVNHDEKQPESQIQGKLVFSVLPPSPHLISPRSTILKSAINSGPRQLRESGQVWL